ncbi:MAG: AraC family transcriptional regulator [Acidiferrobacterales bacterium]|nr:AraC family transcriptional regulator [Acidiferrobacterales bacterium]
MGAFTGHTVLSNLAIIVAETLDTYGLDGRKIVESVGVDYEDAKDPDTRISFEVNQAMWEVAAKESDDPCFGIVAAEIFNPSLLHGLGFSWMASSSLREAFGRMIRFQKLINSAAGSHAIDLGDAVKMVTSLNIPGYEHPDSYALSVLAGMLRLCRLTAGGDTNPLSVSLRMPRPESIERIEQFFQCPVEFDSDANAMVFSKAILVKPISIANPKLARLNDQIVADYLASFDQQSLALQAKSKIVSRLPSGRPNQTEIASSLNMSLRNFQRKLKLEGTSFRELVDEIRKSLAVEFIKDQNRSIGAISYNLGFTEPANFTRSFKSWTGKSPKQYRQWLKEGGAKSH